MGIVVRYSMMLCLLSYLGFEQIPLFQQLHDDSSVTYTEWVEGIIGASLIGEFSTPSIFEILKRSWT